MCGIYCCVANDDVRPRVVEGLKRLEYRGYDSTGIAWINEGQLDVIKAVGRVQQLAELIQKEGVQSRIMLGHTRWATHGPCTVENAHPHLSGGQLALVHNGIIENYLEIEVELQALGFVFKSSTDTEVLAHLLAMHYSKCGDPLEAIQASLSRIEGNYAFVVCFRDMPDRLYGVCNGSPLVAGLQNGSLLFSSDIATLTPVTSQVVYLESGNILYGNTTEHGLIDFQGKQLEINIIESSESGLSRQLLDLGHYRNYTEKEINEQPNAAAETIKSRLVNDGIVEDLCGKGSDEKLCEMEEVHVVGCGSSFHAAMVAQHWFEDLAHIPCRVDIASEFVTRPMVGHRKRLLVLVSQSGETADTIAAVRVAKRGDYAMTLCIVNVANSALTRLCDYRLMTHAGPEVGVATTKALTTQMICLLMLAARMAELGQKTNGGENPAIKTATDGLRELPGHISAALRLEDRIVDLVPEISSKEHVIFLGKGIHYPVAMEGSLKLKELSYIHAEAYPAGELKHGPLALVDYRMSVIAVAPNNALLSKLKNNLNEVRARHGRLIVFADQEVSFDKRPKDEISISLSAPNRFSSPIIHTIPLQLLAYHVSTSLGVDVDKPRNLAKSVTVE